MIRRLTASTIVSLFALALVAVPTAAPTTSAGAGWCRTDPVMLIGGHVVDIFVTAPPEAPTLVTGPNQIVVAVPPGIDAELVAAGPGFGQGEEVTIEERSYLKVRDGSFDVEVRVYVPTHTPMEVGVEFAPDIVGIVDPVVVYGWANEWVTLRTTLPVE